MCRRAKNRLSYLFTFSSSIPTAKIIFSIHILAHLSPTSISDLHASIILYISYHFFLILLKEMHDRSLEVTRWKSYSVNKHHLLPSFLPLLPLSIKMRSVLKFLTLLSNLSQKHFSRIAEFQYHHSSTNMKTISLFIQCLIIQF